MRKIIVAAILTVLTTSPGWAQQGLATSSTVGGRNTIQQAPSGGTPGRAVGAGSNTTGNAGQPTEEERQTEKRNDAATAICKGC